MRCQTAKAKLGSRELAASWAADALRGCSSQAQAAEASLWTGWPMRCEAAAAEGSLRARWRMRCEAAQS